MGTVVGDELAVNKENIRIIPRNKNTIGDGGSTAMRGWMGGLDTPYTVYMNNQTSGQYPEISRKYSDILLGSCGRCRVGKGSDRHCHHPSLINLSNTFFLFNSNFYHPSFINLSNTLFLFNSNLYIIIYIYGVCFCKSRIVELNWGFWPSRILHYFRVCVSRCHQGKGRYLSQTPYLNFMFFEIPLKDFYKPDHWTPGLHSDHAEH